MDRIKESFDSLPIAACFFDKNGVVRLINRRMLAIANWLQKGGIQSLAEMQSALQAPPASVCCLDPRLRIYRFPDGTALRFAQEQITTKAGVRYTQITAADVTELIRKQNQLKAENAKLEKTNKRLKRLLAQMPEIIREEETLAMKLRVHDDIGHSTISALQGNLTGTVSTVETGVYTFENEALEELVMSSSSAPLLPGCYPVLSDTKTTASQPVKSSISVTKSTTLSTPTKSSSLSERADNE